MRKLHAYKGNYLPGAVADLPGAAPAVPSPVTVVEFVGEEGECRARVVPEAALPPLDWRPFTLRGYGRCAEIPRMCHVDMSGAGAYWNARIVENGQMVLFDTRAERDAFLGPREDRERGGDPDITADWLGTFEAAKESGEFGGGRGVSAFWRLAADVLPVGVDPTDPRVVAARAEIRAAVAAHADEPPPVGKLLGQYAEVMNESGGPDSARARAFLAEHPGEEFRALARTAGALWTRINTRRAAAETPPAEPPVRLLGREDDGEID
jgi:hypothetical protein